MLINHSISLVDELRQDRSSILVVLLLLLSLSELVPQVLGLPFHLLGESVTECVFGLALKLLNVSLPPLAFGGWFQQVGGAALGS